MSLKTLSALAASLVLASGAASAATTTCTAGVMNCAAAADGVIPPQGNNWAVDTAFWEGTAESVTIALDAPTTLGQLFLAVDNNDDYIVESSLNGSTWATLGTVSLNDGMVPVFPGGIDWFTSVPGSPLTVASLQFAPTQASFLRVRSTGGDGLYSVGEVLYTAAPVPEPATWALMLAGAVGLALRRRRA